MKNLVIILLLLSSILTFSQEPSKIKFDLVNDRPKSTDKLVNLKLPIEFSFTDKFIDKSIEFISADNPSQSIALKGLKFGDSNLKMTEGTNEFNIEIDINGNVNPKLQNDKKIESDKFKIKIDNSNPIEITIDKTKSAEKNNSENNYCPGYIYYDAIKLSSESDSFQIKNILEAYGVKSDNIDKNPYLKEFFGESTKLNTIQGGLSLLTNLGNTDVTYFAAGLARFLAERTKEELNEAFFNKMKEQLNAYPELKTVFPKTASFLDVIETYSYASVIQVLKESFETDIQNLPENLYDIKNLTSADCNKSAICGDCGKGCDDYTDCKTRLDNLKKFFDSQNGRWIGLGMFTVKEAMYSSNPADLLKSITESPELIGIKKFSKDSSKYDNYNIASSIELGNFISQSLLSKNDNQVWINSKEFNALFKDKDKKTFKIYLGLLLAKEQKGDLIIDFYNSKNLVTFGKFLIDAYKTYSALEPQIISLIKNVHTAFNSADNAVRKIVAASDRSVEADPQELYDYYRTFTASLKPIAQSPLLIYITGNNDIGTNYNVIEQYLNPSVDIAYHISTKKYSAAIYDAVVLLNNSKNPVFEKPVAKSFIKYGTLISTVANAQSSDEVKEAIEASVLPVGSYSIKQKTKWSLSINSYVGAYGSYQNSKKYLPSYGLSAPIGLNISKGLSNTGKYGCLSLNLQVLDLGALVNYYLINGDTMALPNDFKVRLANVFAPGFAFGYSIPSTPLHLAWGGQYIPALYKVEQINSKYEFKPTDAWRFQISLLIDIPLINLKVVDFDK
jgi:hypothetical protein